MRKPATLFWFNLESATKVKVKVKVKKGRDPNSLWLNDTVSIGSVQDWYLLCIANRDTAVLPKAIDTVKSLI